MRTDQTIAKRYTVTAGVTSYAVPFPLYETSDVAVWLSTDGGSTETQLTLGAQYSVTIASDNKSGTIVLVSGVASEGNILAVMSNVPYTQELDLNGVSTINTDATETQLDRDCQQRQQLKDGMDRALTLPVTSTRNPKEVVRAFLAIADNLGEDALSAILEVASDFTGTLEGNFNHDFGIATTDDTTLSISTGGAITKCADNIEDVVKAADFSDVLEDGAMDVIATVASDFTGTLEGNFNHDFGIATTDDTTVSIATGGAITKCADNIEAIAGAEGYAESAAESAATATAAIDIESGLVADHNVSTTSHEDIRALISDLADALADLSRKVVYADANDSTNTSTQGE